MSPSGRTAGDQALEDEAIRSLTPLSALRKYGLGDLTWRRGENWIAAGITAAVVILSATDTLTPDRLALIATGYLAIGTALFGVVLAGLTVVASLLSPSYTQLVGRAGTLADIYFDFVWVAALTAVAIGFSVVVLVQTGATTEDAANSTTIGLSTLLFFASVGGGLRLVWNVMIQGLLSARHAKLAESRSAAAKAVEAEKAERVAQLGGLVERGLINEEEFGVLKVGLLRSTD
jgi:hypothetical protein